jgi:hypothetical protein
MISLDAWLTNYLNGKQIPEECEREMIVTMTERSAENYYKVEICMEAPKFYSQTFNGPVSMDAYFTMLFNGHILGRISKVYVAIDSNVWNRLMKAKKVLIKGQFRNLAIIDVIKIDDL